MSKHPYRCRQIETVPVRSAKRSQNFYKFGILRKQFSPLFFHHLPSFSPLFYLRLPSFSPHHCEFHSFPCSSVLVFDYLLLRTTLVGQCVCAFVTVSCILPHTLCFRFTNSVLCSCCCAASPLNRSPVLCSHRPPASGSHIVLLFHAHIVLLRALMSFSCSVLALFSCFGLSHRSPVPCSHRSPASYPCIVFLLCALTSFSYIISSHHTLTSCFCILCRLSHMALVSQGTTNV
jgi:hypothetical protein